MSEQWCIEKLEKLKIKETRLNTLVEIKKHLNESKNLETKVTNRLLSSGELFDCVDEDDVENANLNRRQEKGDSTNKPLDLVSDILSICMANLSLKQSDLPRLLQRSLRHKKTHIRGLALGTILKELKAVTTNVNGNTNGRSVVLSDELLLHILKALQEPDTCVGIPAVQILLLVLESRLQETWVKDALVEALQKDDTIKCRVYEVGVGLARNSPEVLRNVEYILNHALNQLDNGDDVLTQANVLEILVSLAEQNHGLVFLEKRLVFDVLSKRMVNVDLNPLDRLLMPGIMKFFGKIGSIRPEIPILVYPQTISTLFESLDSDDLVILPTSFDTLVNLTFTHRGVTLLHENFRNSLEKFFMGIQEFLRNLPSDMKLRVLDSVAIIFARDMDSDISVILHEWYNYINKNCFNMQFLLDYCSGPFADLRIACLNVIRSLCVHQWGKEMLKNTAGLLEYVLDRKLADDKETKYLKYCIIQALADSDIFDEVTNHNLRKYVNEGPYYVKPIVNIATEGEGGGDGGDGGGDGSD